MTMFDWVIPVEGDVSRGIRPGIKWPSENMTYDLAIALEIEWDGIWPREPSISFGRGNFTTNIKCYCQSETGRLMKRRKDFRGEYQVCNHRLYGNQTGCGLTIRSRKWLGN